MGVPLAHIAGMPIEETVAMYGPGLLLVFGAASASVGARVRRVRARRRNSRSLLP